MKTEFSTSETLPTTYRGTTIDKETDPWCIKTSRNYRMYRGEFTGEPGTFWHAATIEEAKAIIDDSEDWEEERKGESFQNKEAFQWLMIVLQRDKIRTETFIAENPHIGIQLPSEKDSLNYKWTQWAKQKIENLK